MKYAKKVQNMCSIYVDNLYIKNMCIYREANNYILHNTISLNCKARKLNGFVKRDEYYFASRQN